ncbi:MAG: GrpE protein [Candidatus Azambacteria bacterium GW2011_GWE1_42_9]|nr:MAG: GrpE protein [Candidatus Azambacteria bacterium GW2011_GWF1_41_10]KKS49171.1 MAG: GrpE protein [Candidatus Azambacteria bacterium GW2011_GWF2_42_22]KKS79702.1 MAG: GrpE protein [Candidatus Azambacteria bacterium GW2011_GWE1_42_9]KKT03249.1 MAG: GrpE protein [Candidatus Azambacteria bacterium GW2011_GWD1_43_18]OGD41005.1 MAG: nucleotide exchange factor GrpE [Candidatus Azambacteria bacterium RIFOXYB1_FULL_40_33]OGD41816.1 MAG: nucleotide exchange factor GrpE [Candidatus Azambacteria bac
MNEENNHPSGGHPQGETTKLSELEQCKKQSEEYLNGWKRAKADYLNLKKDMEQQGREIKEWMSKMFILPLLEIMDNFDRAGTLDAGIESIKKQLEDYLKANGVEAMKVAGEKFDPLKHEAMESVDGDESGVVAEEKQKGYLMKGEVLRPAKVKVYK